MKTDNLPDNKIKKEFEVLSGSFVLLLDTHAENYFESVMDSADFMSGKGKKGVYVTISRPYRYLSKEMQKRGIKTENIIFIDCISSMAGEHGSENCVLVENPAALEEVSMHISSSLSKIKSGEKFLIMDSISTLLIYNSLNSVKEFSMFLINKLGLEGVDGVLVTLGKESPEDLKQILIAMCDKVIYV